MTRWMLLLALGLLIPTAAGQINGAHEFEADYGFANPSTAEFTTVLSGALEAKTAGSTGPYGFFDAVGLRITDLSQVCRGLTSSDCHTGELTLVVEDGGSAGIQFLTRPSATYTADHALGLFLDARGDDLNSLPLNQSLLAPAVNGRMEFNDIPYLPSTGPFGIKAPSATITPTAADTAFVLLDGTTPIERWTGKSDIFRLYGPASIPEFASDFVILPFKEGSVATVVAADAEAAKEGLDFQRLQAVFQKLNDASAGGGESTGGGVGDSPLEDALAEVLDAAVIRFPSSSDGNGTADDFALVLFKTMEVSNLRGDLAWRGDASFEMQGSEVVGAQSLFGFWFFKLPWWGWALWAVAGALIITRLAVRPDKTHERWDQYRWIGWVAGVAMFLLVFFLWDIEMRAVWGTSVLTTKTAGTAFWITLGIQLGTMALVLGAVSWPISIITKNALLLSKQGNFMGLGKPLSMLFAYLLGATLLLAYIELLITSVIENLPS